MSSSDESLGEAFVAEAVHTLRNALGKIEHCLNQLGDADVHWRARSSQNSISNIILHLCGNVRQWIVSGIGGEPDRRERAKEFSDRSPLTRAELLERLGATVAAACDVLAKVSPRKLLEKRRIQSFEVTGVSALMDCVSHFVGHTHQIVYITRLRVGDRYQFQFVPKGAEQGAP